ncbi:asparagine synthase (glutamine-hydrolyzing) [Panacibacter sp. DH6]|uniref:asparagine synthase (glutamine-hydrolyzing) n=1 Tax=Panacibacter microcysteis TaxID=2793269 RepID=A0A931E860_9BACT|nr:asparagine synthase (glutamine-hydrolyzing) [Panacibacter microcysteis]MBG9377151.1 asparagine synthase (glutamine-hydrolyzing) [Panacibacter microcysteis]
MCGIVGAYYFTRAEGQKEFIHTCLQSMHHRGPDANGYWTNNMNYHAGFARLAIRDLSANGNQPMLTSDQQFCISFNGEIYNTDYIRQLLAPFGVQYKSTTDTEVLLYALCHLGIETTLKVADGIFAFAFFDVAEHKLVLARDRLGIKPLYVATHHDAVIYSSQYDHIISHPLFAGNSINEDALGAYLNLGYVPENTGILQHTLMLPHGYYYTITQSGSTMQCYYRYGFNRVKTDTDTEQVLSKAVQSQMVADVPVGTFMSGGVDSTLVTSYANRLHEVQSFTIGIKDAKEDETATAQFFANTFKTKHAVKFFDNNVFVTLIKDHFKAFTEPFADYSSLPTLLLSSFAKEKVTVALSGDGGDELFWGYPRNRKTLDYIDLYNKSGMQKKAHLLFAKMLKPAKTDVNRHWSYRSLAGYYYSSLFVSGAIKWIPEIYKGTAAPAFFFDKIVEEEKDQFYSNTSAMNLVRRLEIDLHLQRILLKVDRASMYHSLEVRVPMLANSMLDFSETLKYTDCIKQEQGKFNLKSLLAQKAGDYAFLPKKGFTIPMDEILRSNEGKAITDAILQMPAALSVYFDMNAMEKLVRQHQGRKANAGWMLWTVYALVNWYSTWYKK